MTHFIDSLLKPIDDLLNRITMYRLALYELIALLIAACLLGIFHLVPVSPLYLIYSTALIFILAWVVNRIFAWAFNAPSNPESTYITALILALIIAPPSGFVDVSYFALAGWATSIAIASKYIFAFRDKHIFNPAAFGVAATALFLGFGATWWVGSMWMLPFVLIGGLLIVRKIRRFDLVLSFGIVAVLTIFVLGLAGGSLASVLKESIVDAPLVFLGTVMLIEPLTSPPTSFLRILYGALVGFLYAPQVHFGSFYFTPELALLTGNIFSYIVSPQEKLILILEERIQLTPDTFEFVFKSNRRMRFVAGQYLEWTLAHKKADNRGIRRYFTIASSPRDPDFRLGVKFYEPSSTFKKALLALMPGQTMVAAQLAGDFTLPHNKSQKLVFIAGGIGITPFRSMLQYLLDLNEKRDICVLYGNRTTQDVAYAELLKRAESELGIRTIHIFAEQGSRIDQQLILTEIPDYQERTFYLSGPRAMVLAHSDLLNELGIPEGHIKRDFFPGFA